MAENNHEDNQENTPEQEFSEDASLEGVESPSEGFPENDGEGATDEIPEVVIPEVAIPEVVPSEEAISDSEGVTFSRDLDEDMQQDTRDLLEAEKEDDGSRMSLEDYTRFSKLNVNVSTPKEYDRVQDLYWSSSESTKKMLDKCSENVALGLFYWEDGDIEDTTLSLEPLNGLDMVGVIESMDEEDEFKKTDLDLKSLLSTLDDEDVLADLGLYVGRLLAGLTIVVVTGAVVGSVAVAVAKATSQKADKGSSEKSSPVSKAVKVAAVAKGTKAATRGAKKAAKVTAATKGAKALAQKAKQEKKEKESQKRKPATGARR